MITDIITFFRSKKFLSKPVVQLTGFLLIIWTVIFGDSSHAHTWAEKYIPGFWSLFTIAACTGLIYFVRWLRIIGLQTREDYYDQ